MNAFQDLSCWILISQPAMVVRSFEGRKEGLEKKERPSRAAVPGITARRWGRPVLKDLSNLPLQDRRKKKNPVKIKRSTILSYWILNNRVAELGVADIESNPLKKKELAIVCHSINWKGASGVPQLISLLETLEIFSTILIISSASRNLSAFKANL